MKSANSVPIATYRLQFNSNFTFKQANELVDYFHDLGISHPYSSPLLKSRPGSVHGYDIIDHGKFNLKLDQREEIESFVQNLRKNGMGLIIDIVPQSYVYY